jgi:CheY-like chemotaxis protein
VFADVEEKPYVGIKVADTGTGMDEATRARIFEPFFSTKEKGKGSGLGLAVVYGIVKSHHGFIDVESTPEKGSTFSLFFPKGSLSASPARPVEQKPSGGNETILFVEDEPLLGEVILRILREQGYTVLEAVDGIEAVDVFMKNHQRIDVVLSDIGLPRLGGWAACVTMKEIKPDVRIILASGFLEPSVRDEMTKVGITTFVEKPYVPDEILRNIREIMKKL